MKKLFTLIFSIFMLNINLFGKSEEKKPVLKENKEIELVFVLDTTGSMEGLINGAKTKIWGIVNDVLQNQGKDSKVKIGLIGYRDRGDEYVTKITQLSENIDEVYEELMGFVADGGGDTPEDVRRALHEGINVIQWSTSQDTSQIMFLVGDAPPHTDYKDYPSTVDTAKKAKEKGIIINTIQCGNLTHTDKFWKEISQYAGGEYFAIAQDGGTQVTSTPYDEELEKLANKLDQKYIPYGTKSVQSSATSRKKANVEKIAEAPLEAKAARAVNKSMNKYSYSRNDLVQEIENGTLKLSSIKKEELPETMQKMSDKEQEEFVNTMIEERKQIKSEITKISKERESYIQKNSKEKADSFDASVSDALKKQIK